MSWPSAWKVGAVAQEAPGTDTSLLDTVLEADTERGRPAGRGRAPKPTATSWAISMQRLDAIDAYTAPVPRR